MRTFGLALLLMCQLGATSPGATLHEQAEAARQAFATGLAAYQQGELNRAEEQFAKAVELAPTWGLATLHLGMSRVALDATSALGLTDLEHAVALEPQNPRAHMQLGLAYERINRFGDAARELRQAVALRGDMDEARYHLATVLAQTGPAQEAIDAFVAVLAEQPRHLGALSALADLYEEVGQLQKAEAALVAIVRLHPAVPYHQYRLGKFYERTGELKKASRVYAELEERDPRQRKMRKLR